uniref:pro-adrenomedullin n=1 Tax=Scatophagus argus TaxID=75038 RepID=UPI001ED85FAA|nr:pro-adrenomedullin [Scatophagus argus]
MRLALHTVICCCVFTSVLPLVKGATGELNTSLKKRFRVWLQSRTKRDLQSSLLTVNDCYSDTHVGSQQHGHTITVSPPSSFGLNIRPRRSASSKSSGCVLVTCAYHDLLYRLHQINNRQKQSNAPETKIGSNGYGRRRRSLQDVTQLALQTGRQSGSPEAAFKVSLAAETEDNPWQTSLTCP